MKRTLFAVVAGIPLGLAVEAFVAWVKIHLGIEGFYLWMPPLDGILIVFAATFIYDLSRQENR